MSIRDTGFGIGLDRRKLLAGSAAGTALAVSGLGRYTVAAQDATPAAAACAEPFDAARLSTVTMVTDGEPITVAIVPKLVHPFFEDCRIGAEEEAGELGVTFEWVAPQTGDPAIQVKMIEDLISKQVNAIVISPNEPTSVVPVINDGLSKGILMMTFDSDSPESDRVMYIGTDNKTAGMVQGDTMREALGGSGKVGIITGGLGALNLNERIEGFRETVGPDIEIVEVVATEESLERGLGVSEALLRAHPDLNGVACVSATGGPTLAQVIQGPEFADRELTIVAFDDLEEVLRAIEDGIIYATMVQRPVQMGVLSISMANDILTQGLVPECALLDTGVTVVTLENLETYTK
ncbi:MAG: sugar-binding protein [Thermomicrobiales bacterium]